MVPGAGNFDLRQLSYFAAVVDCGSFTAAAREVHIAQPSLSVAIRNLEKQLGTPLLERSPKGVRPTAAGAYLREVAGQVLHQLADTDAQLRSLGQGRSGRLSLAVTPTYSWAHLSGVLRTFATEAPGVQVVLRDPPPLEIVNLLTARIVEIGIVATHDVTALRSDYGGDFHLRPICELPIVCVLPPDRGDAPAAVALDDLRDDAWVVPTPSRTFPGMAALVETLWRRAGWTPAVIREVSTSQTGLPIVAGGLGVALMPSSVTRIADIAVVVRPIADPVPPLIATVLWCRDRPLTPAASRFIDLLLAAHASPTVES